MVAYIVRQEDLDEYTITLNTDELRHELMRIAEYDDVKIGRRPDEQGRMVDIMVPVKTIIDTIITKTINHESTSEEEELLEISIIIVDHDTPGWRLPASWIDGD